MIEERGEVYLKVSNRKSIILLRVRYKCTDNVYLPCEEFSKLSVPLYNREKYDILNN